MSEVASQATVCARAVAEVNGLQNVPAVARVHEIVYVAHGWGFKWFDRLAFRREAEQGSRYDEFVGLSMLENC